MAPKETADERSVSQAGDLTALGFQGELDRIYRILHSHDGISLEELAAETGRPLTVIREQIGFLIQSNACRVERGKLFAVAELEATIAFVRRDAERLARVAQRLERLATVLPVISATDGKIAPPELGTPLDGQVWHGDDVANLIRSWVRTGANNEVCSLRPDQWATPLEESLTELAAELAAEGRSVRGIYPAQALQSGAEVLRERARLGESIRLLPEVPHRMMVVPGVGALLPEPLTLAATHRLITGQEGLVSLAERYFNLLWSQAVPWGQRRLERERRMMLQQLADGAKDEQIARATGLSLRTVRRRIADLMAELGAESRFQAGLEAARRGWV